MGGAARPCRMSVRMTIFFLFPPFASLTYLLWSQSDGGRIVLMPAHVGSNGGWCPAELGTHPGRRAFPVAT